MTKRGLLSAMNFPPNLQIHMRVCVKFGCFGPPEEGDLRCVFKSFNCLIDAVIHDPPAKCKEGTHLKEWHSSRFGEAIPLEALRVAKGVPYKHCQWDTCLPLHAPMPPLFAVQRRSTWESSNKNINFACGDRTMTTMTSTTATTLGRGIQRPSKRR